MEERIRTALRAAIENGTRKIRVTYAREKKWGIFALMNLANAGMIVMSTEERMTAAVVGMSGVWQCDEDRTFTIILTESLREEMFVNVMAQFLEKIEYARPRQEA